jgi:hypothetical protein
MAKNFTIVVSGDNDELPVVDGNKVRTLGQLVKYFRSMAGGARLGATTMKVRNTAVAASGTLALSTASGVVGAKINGVSFTVTASGALVQNLVTASASGANVTVTAVVPGKVGNCITLEVAGAGSGHSVTTGDRLVGGSETLISFSY